METSRDLASLVVPLAGELVATDDPWEPYRLLDPSGAPVGGVADYLQDIQGAGRSSATALAEASAGLVQRSYLWAFGIEWDRPTREDARDFMLWMKLADKPVRVRWRHLGKDPAEIPRPSRTGKPANRHQELRTR